MPILQAFIFPTTCWTVQDDELWEEDPAECIRSRFVDSLMQDVASVPAFSAANLIVDIIKCRRKACPDAIPWLPHSTPCTLSGFFRQGIGLHQGGRLLCPWIHVPPTHCPDDALRSQMEHFIVSFVLPVLTDSKFPFLQARGCWVIEQLLGDKSEFKFSDPSNVMSILKAIIQCLLDTNHPLPVRVQAALCLSPLLDFEEVQQAVPAGLARIVESILQISEQVELDALAFTLERIVSMFPGRACPLCRPTVHPAGTHTCSCP